MNMKERNNIYQVCGAGLLRVIKDTTCTVAFKWAYALLLYMQ